VTDVEKAIANPLLVLREEFDDWAILFDPDTGNAHGLNPVSVFIWKFLDGNHSIRQIHDELRENCQDMPDDAERYIREFIAELVGKGYAGYQTQ
jgi:SynChlorMet cassette protein ScmD